MRTTVDLPPAVHARAKKLAAARHESMSAVVAELAARGLAQLDEPLAVTTDAESGFPVVSLGRRITADEVAELIDEE